MSATLEAAIHYAEKLLWSVIPISPGSKIPPKDFPVVQYRNRIASREEIEGWWRKNPSYNVGIVTGKLSGILAIDHDLYKPEYSEEEALKYIPDNIITPTASTPRGGQHQLFRFPDKPISIGTAFIPGMDFRGEGGYIVAPPSTNGNGNGYEWIIRPDEIELATVPEPLLKKILLYARKGFSKAPPENHRKPQDTTETTKIFTEGRRDEDLFHHAYVLFKGGMERENIAQAIEFIANNCIPPFPISEALRKVESAFQRFSQRNDGGCRNIAGEIEEWVKTTEGNFKTTESHKELQITTKDHKKAAMMAFLRLKERGIIEKVGNIHGCYRRIDTTVEYMDFASADLENYVPLKLPLGIHTKTKFFPKGVIVIAGVSGKGKTLFCHNAIAENMGNFPIFYFNSEMGPEALKKKLSYFPIEMDVWKKHMKAIAQWDFNNIADKIQPDAFNVIDYLEPEGEKPFNIHGVISSIIKRLNQGMALIAIQKKPDAKLGVGGIYSIKAATLALALDWGKIEVIKNRFREEDSFPSSDKINFEVHKGYQFVKQGNWYK